MSYAPKKRPTHIRCWRGGNVIYEVSDDSWTGALSKLRAEIVIAFMRTGTVPPKGLNGPYVLNYLLECRICDRIDNE